MIEILNNVSAFIKQYTPYIIGGAIGSVIHRMRSEMNFITFIKLLIMSVFISVCTGILCKDYFGITNENILFMFCGISGVFSKIILDELEAIIKLAASFVKLKVGLTKNNEQP